MAEKRRVKRIIDTAGNTQVVYFETTAEQTIFDPANTNLESTTVQAALKEINSKADDGGVTGVKGDAELTYRQGNINLTPANIGLGNVLDAEQIPVSQKGVASGVATLDASGKIPLTQINDTILGQVEYLGQWNSSAGIIAGNDLRTPSARLYRKGDYYINTVAGNKVPKPDGTEGSTMSAKHTWEVGDWLIFTTGLDQFAWEKVDNTDAVSSVNGKTGAIVLSKADISDLTNIDNTSDAAKKVLHAISADEATTATTATKLTTARTLSVKGDASGDASFDGSTNVDITLTLADSGVMAGTYSIVAVNEKGLITAGNNLIEWGTAGQTVPAINTAIGGIFFEQQE